MLGLPLARPSRRLVAMGVDLLLVALLVKSGGVFLGIVAAILLFRASAPDPKSGFIKRSVRTALRVAGAIVLFMVIFKGWGSLKDKLRSEERHATEEELSDSTADF